MKTSLTIHLCGPLQSYGYKDYNSIRQTKQEPTKSAVAGIIACCGGISRDSVKKIEESFDIINIRRLKTPSYLHEEKEMRPDEYYGILIDYQIAKGGKDSLGGWENPIIRADGKFYEDSIIIKRGYLMDAYFQVKISGEEETIKKYKKWLKNPVWQPYLGRKCCVPSLPLIIEKE